MVPKVCAFENKGTLRGELVDSLLGSQSRLGIGGEKKGLIFILKKVKKGTREVRGERKGEVSERGSLYAAGT